MDGDKWCMQDVSACVPSLACWLHARALQSEKQLLVIDFMSQYQPGRIWPVLACVPLGAEERSKTKHGDS